MSGTATVEDFVAFRSRWRVALLLVGAVAFVVAGLWMAGVFGPPPVSRRYSATVTLAAGWLAVIFFGLCGIAAARTLFDTGEQLRIGPAGIRWMRWSDRTIPWAEIVEVTTWSFKAQHAIVLHLRDPAEFPGRGSANFLARINRQLTEGDISFSLTGLDRSFDEALSAIVRFQHPEHDRT